MLVNQLPGSEKLDPGSILFGGEMFLGSGSTILSCHRGLPGLPNMEIDLTEIYAAEKRLVEIKFITPEKSMELTSVFNKAMSDLQTQIVLVEHEASVAARYVNKIEASIMIDEATDILKNKGLANSADMRKAVVKNSKDYQDAADRYDALNAMAAFLTGKLEMFKRAYFDTKDVIKIAGIERSYMGRTNVHAADFGDKLQDYENEDMSKMD